MRKIKDNELTRMNVEDWELQNFTVFEYPKFDTFDKDASIRGVSIFFRSPSKNNLFVEREEATQILEYRGIIADDEEFILKKSYSAVLCNKKDIDELKKNLNEFEKAKEEFKQFAESINYRRYYHSDDYSIDNTHQENMDNVKSWYKEAKKWQEDELAKSQGTNQMQKFAQEFNEIGVYKNKFLTVYKDEILVKENSYYTFEIKILLHKHLTGLEVARFDRELKNYAENDEYKLDQLSKFLMDLDFTILFNEAKIEHTINEGQFRIKYNKTNRWAKGGDMHRAIIDLKKFKDSLLILDFYENSNKPAGEYYNKIKFDGAKEGHTIPVTLKRKDGNIYIVSVMDGIEFEQSLYITNNKKKAFEDIKAKGFTLDVSLKNVYQKMIEKEDKVTALHKIKTLKALLNI